jgi:cytochrome b6-f complex iron-sulfur subunit
MDTNTHARTDSTVVSAGPAPASPVSRRQVLLGSFWAAIGAFFAGGVATAINTVYPRNVRGFGGPIAVPASAIPAPGDPPRSNLEGRFWLVNLEPDEGALRVGETPSPGGLVALYKKCPHLGCSVPWRDSATIPTDDRQGWFLCPCHSSTYTTAGVRVAGPAPRSMDTMTIEVLRTGNIVVQTGSITEGGVDNPLRAVPYAL